MGAPIVNEISVAKPQADVIISLQEMINNTLQGIAKASAERKKLNEMLESSLMNDSTYREHQEAAKKAVKVRNGTKIQILSQPETRKLAEKSKDLGREIKEAKGALSDYLLEYQRLAGVTQLDLFDGQTVEIVKTAKVIRPSRRK